MAIRNFEINSSSLRQSLRQVSSGLVSRFAHRGLIVPNTANGGSIVHPKQQTNQRAPKRIPGYSPERETAEELSVSVRTLRKWRQLRIGPPYIEVGRQIHYRDESRATWLRSREVQPVRSQGSA